jgi:REP element-mobilizing transposase RayT
MILGYHVIFGAYGFWLPNDPRGSWSDFVGSWELWRYGPATKTLETHSLASREHDSGQRLAAKQALKYPPVTFTGIQARAIAQGFSEYVARSGLTVWACAILPDHVHLVIARSRLTVERVVIQLKGAATEQLVAETIHPFGDIVGSNGRRPKCFERGQWKVFLDSPEDIQRAIEYVENNPIKEGKKRQRWSFVRPLDAATLIETMP